MRINFDINMEIQPGTFRQAVHEIGKKYYWGFENKSYLPRDLLRSKTDMNRIFKLLGVPTPHLIFGKTHFSEIVFPEENEFVLKPDFGVGSQGVFVLERRDEMFFDHFNKSRFTEHELKERIEGIAAARKKYRHWVAEERLTDSSKEGLVVDYKFYCFFGKSPLLLVKLNKPNRYAWLNCAGNMVDTGEYNDRHASDFAPPPNIGELWQMAENISKKIPLPFCRVDLYNTSGGVVAGELTPTPGRPEYLFNDEWEGILLDNLRDGLGRLSHWENNEVFELA